MHLYLYVYVYVIYDVYVWLVQHVFLQRYHISELPWSTRPFDIFEVCRTMPWCKWGSTLIVSSIVFSRESGFSSRSTAIWFLTSNGIVGGYRKSLATSAKSQHSIGLLLTSKSCSLPSSVWWSPSGKNNFRESQGLHSKVSRRGQRHLHEMGINPWTSWILFWLLVLLDIQFRCLIRGLNQSKPLWNTWRLSKTGSWVKTVSMCQCHGVMARTMSWSLPNLIQANFYG